MVQALMIGVDSAQCRALIWSHVAGANLTCDCGLKYCNIVPVCIPVIKLIVLLHFKSLHTKKKKKNLYIENLHLHCWAVGHCASWGALRTAQVWSTAVLNSCFGCVASVVLVDEDVQRLCHTTGLVYGKQLGCCDCSGCVVGLSYVHLEQIHTFHVGRGTVVDFLQCLCKNQEWYILDAKFLFFHR